MLTEKEEIRIREEAMVRLDLALQLCREVLTNVRMLGLGDALLEGAIDALVVQIADLDNDLADDDEVPDEGDDDLYPDGDPYRCG